MGINGGGTDELPDGIGGGNVAGPNTLLILFLNSAGAGFEGTAPDGALGFGCTPVAIEMTENAISLADFVHPERAMYVFGSEYGGIKQETVNWCEKTVYIPTRVSLNLAVTVNLVLYDRMNKRHGLNLSKGDLEKFGI